MPPRRLAKPLLSGPASPLSGGRARGAESLPARDVGVAMQPPSAPGVEFNTTNMAPFLTKLYQIVSAATRMDQRETTASSSSTSLRPPFASLCAFAGGLLRYPSVPLSLSLAHSQQRALPRLACAHKHLPSWFGLGPERPSLQRHVRSPLDSQISMPSVSRSDRILSAVPKSRRTRACAGGY